MFTSSDSTFMLGNYTFTKTDLGSHTFTVTLNTLGMQTITATDTVKSTITGTASVIVNPGRDLPLDNRFLGMGSDQHPLAVSATVAGSRTLSVDSTVTHTLPTPIPIGIVANARVSGPLRAKKGLSKGSLSLADLDSFLEAEGLAQGGG
jgi:hypothetical protein